MTSQQAFAQGARCGHLEGQGRAGEYVIGEEVQLSWDAADNQGLSDPYIALMWEAGYQYGYLRAAEGESLPEEMRQ
jgi:hypothetical protein